MFQSYDSYWNLQDVLCVLVNRFAVDSSVLECNTVLVSGWLLMFEKDFSYFIFTVELSDMLSHPKQRKCSAAVL